MLSQNERDHCLFISLERLLYGWSSMPVSKLNFTTNWHRAIVIYRIYMCIFLFAQIIIYHIAVMHVSAYWSKLRCN
jgi:hypothetical protein